MSVVFAASETSGLRVVGTAADNATAGTFRAANSRAAVISSDAASIITAFLDAALTDVWIRFTAYSAAWDNDASTEKMKVLNSADGGVVRIVTNAPGVFFSQYWNGAAWVTFGSVWNITAGTTNYAIQLKTGASGTCVILAEGTIVSTGTIGAATTNVKKVILGTPDNNIAGHFSEVVIASGGNSLVGSALETEAPTADATDLGGAGTFADIDEAVNSDSDFITFAAAGDRRSFTSPARTGGLDVALGVGVAARAKRDVGGPQNMRFYLKIGGVRYYGATIALTLGFEAYQYFWSQNPATGAAFTPAEAAAAELEWGIEAVA